MERQRHVVGLPPQAARPRGLAGPKNERGVRLCVPVLNNNDRADFDTTQRRRSRASILKLQRQAASAQPARKRVPWHNDGPNDSVSYLSVLMNWMTSGNNYSRYRGQNGETKQTLASEVVDRIAASGITTARTSKDVMTKILGLESSFRVASDWLSNTGQGVENEESLRAAVLHRCPPFFELYKIMDDSPSTHPLLLNTDPGFNYSDTGSESSSSEGEYGPGVNGGGSENAHGSAASRAYADAIYVPYVSTRSLDSNASSAATANPTGMRAGSVLQSIISGKLGKKSPSATEVTHEKLISRKEAQLLTKMKLKLKIVNSIRRAAPAAAARG